MELTHSPQCLFLDEPTNFLDREALGGLAVAIKEWGGAVCIISHSTEFVTALCPEIWHVDNGELTHKGKVALVEDAFDDPSRPGSRTTSKAGTPRISRVGTPAASSVATSAANSGDEGTGGTNTPAEGAGADGVIDDLAKMALKPKKKKKKTRNEIKASEERKRIRKVNWLSYGGMSLFVGSVSTSRHAHGYCLRDLIGRMLIVQVSVSPTPIRTRHPLTPRIPVISHLVLRPISPVAQRVH